MGEQFMLGAQSNLWMAVCIGLFIGTLAVLIISLIAVWCKARREWYKQEEIFKEIQQEIIGREKRENLRARLDYLKDKREKTIIF